MMSKKQNKIMIYNADALTLKNLYIDKKISLSKIARMYGCSHSTAKKHMINLGIEIRNQSDANKLVNAMPHVKRKKSEILKGKKSRAFGKRWKWKEESISKLNRFGENNSNWKGGISKDIDHLRRQRANHKAIRRGKSPHLPAWADIQRIEDIYKKSRELGMTVDHIVPLCNKIVCGLHCEDNLRIISIDENRKKGNKFIESLLYDKSGSDCGLVRKPDDSGLSRENTGQSEAVKAQRMSGTGSAAAIRSQDMRSCA